MCVREDFGELKGRVKSSLTYRCIFLLIHTADRCSRFSPSELDRTHFYIVQKVSVRTNVKLTSEIQKMLYP